MNLKHLSMTRETLLPLCTVLCEYLAGSRISTIEEFKLELFFLFRLAHRMNGHSGAAERLLESVGIQMINTRDAKGR